MITRWYAKFLYSLFISLVRIIYIPPKSECFQTAKHKKMVELADIGEKIFNVLVAIVSKETRYNYRIAVDYQDCRLLIRPFIFSEILMVSGLWENYVKNILFSKVDDSDTVVDIGANIGVYAIPLAKRVTKVIAFEPHPVTFEMLKESVKLNDLNNVVLIKKAVGDSKSKVLFNLSSRPMNSGVSAQVKPDHAIEVESIDLDTVLATEKKIDWLLIDVEGFEVNVVNGAKRLIHMHSPEIIIESDNILRKENIEGMLAVEGYSFNQIYGMYYYATKI